MSGRNTVNSTWPSLAQNSRWAAYPKCSQRKRRVFLLIEGKCILVATCCGVGCMPSKNADCGRKMPAHAGEHA